MKDASLVLDTPPPSVLLVTGRRELVEQLAPVAAAVGVGLKVEADLESAGRRWLESAVVLLGEDAAARGVPVRRPGVVLVAVKGAPERFWKTALELGAEQAVVLPDDQEWLLERLAEVADPGAGAGVVVAVAAGRGAAGGSTLAACLAISAGSGRRTLLVDADPYGAGLDVLLGCEHEPGLRWADLHDLRGPVRGASLRRGLPRARGVSVLTWAGGSSSELRPEAMESVLQAGRRHFHLVVVDLPPPAVPATLAALARADLAVLIVPSEVHGTLAAARRLAVMRPLVGDIRLVVRGPAPGGLDAEQVADALGLPLTARIAAEPRVSAVLERGELPAARGPLRRFCRSLLANLDNRPAANPEHWAVTV